MDILLHLTGTTPLLCHNIQLADPDNQWTREIAAITAKRKKTEEDRVQIARLEWYGGLYTAPGFAGPVLPAANVRKSLIQAGKVSKQGLQVSRSLILKVLSVPIVHDGPATLDALYARPEHHYRTAVGIGGSRTMRTRPMFPAWQIQVSALLIDDVMDLQDLERIVERAGVVEGIGDNRVNGFGRFSGAVVVSP